MNQLTRLVDRLESSRQGADAEFLADVEMFTWRLAEVEDEMLPVEPHARWLWVAEALRDWQLE